MSKIIPIHSFRGGTGKSNITANVAFTVARRGHRVGIIDTDIQSPGIHAIFGMGSEQMDHALNDYLWGKCSIEKTAYDVTERGGGTCPAPAQGKVYLIPSSVKTGEIVRVLREGYDVGILNDGLRDVVDALKLDYLFIDTHPGLNEETLLSMAISDIVLIIMRPDQQDYQGTAVTVDVARSLDVPEMYLIVNKVPSSLDAGDVKARVEESYGIPVLTVLPLSETMVELGSAGVFCLQYPDNTFSQGIASIADGVTGKA